MTTLSRRREERLRAILSMRDYTEKRKELRKLVQFDLEHSVLSATDISRMYAKSSLVGNGMTQINPRPTISGLRDALDEETMVALAYGDITVGEIIKAIEEPETHAHPKLGRERTPYRFGRPITLTVASYAGLASRILSKPTTEDTMSDFHLGLSQCMQLADIVGCKFGTDIDSTLDIICEQFDTYPREAVRSALMLREGEFAQTTKPSDLDEITNEAYALIVELASEEDDEPVATSAYDKPEGSQAQLIDLALSSAGLPPIAKLIDELNDASSRIASAEARAIAMPTMAGDVECSVGDTNPKGRVTTIKAHTAFGLKRGKEAFDFDVPIWEWDSPHAHVPDIDADYVFRPFELFRILYALITNQRAYLHGHTGSGKTTLVEQVAARLQWPFMRVNFDSEITRMDLIGRDVLTNEGGVTSSTFVEGILPQMMSGPYIGCFDELDFVRPDVAYVMQRAFEGNGLMLTEDGGRMVKPHRMFRMFATGNTVGQGDEFGMYQGARPQSLALLDRFTVWVHVDYMSSMDRKRLIKSRCPALDETQINKVDQYVGEHLEAFKTSKVLQPISPRSYIALGNAIATFTTYFPDTKASVAVAQAIETVILDRSTAQDRAVLKGIADRVFA